MKLVHIEHLIHKGAFAQSATAASIDNHIKQGIRQVYWPPTSGAFTLLEKRKGNGVKPIKNDFVAHLSGQNWQLEKRMRLTSDSQPGKIDAVYELTDGRHFAVEWETGNISSSHRALNKMALGIQEGCLAGGALILPSGAMYPYLTDRIGNYPEIMPYFPLWKKNTNDGILSIYVIEHDNLSPDAPAIPKETDGRALR